MKLGDGVSKSFGLPADYSLSGVTVDGVVTAPTRTLDGFTTPSAPALGAQIVISGTLPQYDWEELFMPLRGHLIVTLGGAPGISVPYQSPAGFRWARVLSSGVPVGSGGVPVFALVGA